MATLTTTPSEQLKTLYQIRILDLPGAFPPGWTSLPMQKEDVGFPDQERDDKAMIMEATQNRTLSESFVASRGMIGMWNMVELMLRAECKVIKWKNSDQVRSHLGIPLLAEHFYSMLSSVQQAIWSGAKVFQIDPVSDTPIDAAVAQSALITAEIKNCGYKGMPMKYEVRSVLYDGLLYGYGAGMMGWEKKKFRVLKKTGGTPATTVATSGGASFDVPQEQEDEAAERWKPAEIEVSMPHFEHVPIRRLRVAPDCRRSDIRTASWAGRLIYLSSYDLDKLRDVQGFSIPTREQLIALTTPQKLDSTSTNPLDTQGSNTANPIFQQTTTPQKAYPENYADGSTYDPLGKKFEVFDYWTDSRHAMILENQYCILNEGNDDGTLPFLGFAFREAPDSLYGYGLGFWLADFQRISQGIINAFFDDLNLNLMGTYAAPSGMQNLGQNQWIFPGKIFKSDPQGEFKALTRNAIQAQEPLSVIEFVRSLASQVSGAGAGITGATQGAPGDVRVKKNVEVMAQGEATKAQDLIDVIADQILVPFFTYCVEHNRNLKPSVMRQILSQELEQSLKVSPITIQNGLYKVNISAGAKLAARQALNQSLGFIESMLEAPGTVEMLAVQGMKIDYKSMISALFESTGYPYREQIVVPMNDEDKARLAATQQKPDKSIEKIHVTAQEKRKTDDNQAENRLLIHAGQAALKSGQSTQDHQEDVQQMALQRAERAGLQKSDAQFEGEGSVQ